MPKKAEVRPNIASIKTSKELRRWYWLKTELAAEAKRVGVKTTGAKFTILERLCHLHDTGDATWPGDSKAAKLRAKNPGTSTFDWHSAKLTKNTRITQNYKNTQNVRRYFKTNVGPSFNFNIALMAWFKNHVGSTLGEAGQFWQAQQANKAPTKIKPHNQFNQYTRDFLKDNPQLGMAEVRACWALKKALPSESGRHKYERSDLALAKLK